MTKKKGPECPNQYSYSDSSADQRQRLLNALREGPKSTIWLRRELDIMMPAARVHELRHGQGFNIQTHRCYVHTESGNEHSVAEYVLMPGKWRGVTHD
ncbi:MAG: helix-turn-helix domain-containing protein [Candidatus Thiodiazotropha sp. (ex Ctena orbiculata)]|uniref:Helix-turn-helix domain-containing protein n=1 Tax=Candidatus Thiodiazotropha taylori TaxID=2792791 RepID=A0A944QTW0_9GAMM|nr:helix-turn-helix domain-containing protein [Candidatus Thiodiazotropha taylori]MBV2138795.1 helix-turn-helix domain-containing protein [Candidatus Thiodiazotropha taylori]